MTAIEFQYKLISLQESLMRFAYTLTADMDDAKDLLQETFLKALTYCDKFVHNDNFKAWTYTIMKNTFINNYRRSVRYKNYNDQTKEGFFLNYIHSSGSYEPDSLYISKESVSINVALPRTNWMLYALASLRDIPSFKARFWMDNVVRAASFNCPNDHS